MVDVQSPPVPPGPTPRPGQRRSRSMVAGLVLVIVGGLVAIGVLLSVEDDGPSTGGPLGTGTVPVPTSPSTVDPQAATKAAILDAYRSSHDAVLAVASDPNGQPTDPRLEEHKIGNALLAAQASIDRLRKAGHVVQGTMEVHPVVVEVAADTAVVEDCGIDRLSILNAATGEVVTAPAADSKGMRARATYKLIDGRWMQNSFRDLKQECVPAG